MQNNPHLQNLQCDISVLRITLTEQVTADMNVAHSLRAAIPPSPYTWSSRGPNAEGGAGVSISAPGAAITCVRRPLLFQPNIASYYLQVPVWTGNAQQLMNGTSMSSPNAAGCFALAASAAIADGVQTSPTSLRRAFENTADSEVSGVQKKNSVLNDAVLLGGRLIRCVDAGFWLHSSMCCL